MSLSIAQKLVPFSLREGSFCILPKSLYSLRVYPALFQIYDRHQKRIEEIKLEHSGPFSAFQVQANLDKGLVEIYGRGNQGYFSLQVAAQEGGIFFFLKRGEPIFCTLFFQGKTYLLKKNSPLKIPISLQLGNFSLERLSFGMHKKQDIESIYRRKDPKEIFPLWHKIGALLPSVKNPVLSGVQLLLKESEEALFQKQVEKTKDLLLLLFQIAFSGIYVPSLEDLTYQNLKLPPKDSSSEPYWLLKQGSFLIRSLFFQERGDSLIFLPHLSKEFAFGRFCYLTTSWGIVHMEWSKKSLRRVVLQAKNPQSLCLIFPSSIRKYRLKRAPQERGIQKPVKEAITLQANQRLYLDRFEA